MQYMKKKNIKLDLTGLRCPLPVLKTAKKIKEIETFEVLEINIDDYSSVDDLKELCENNNLSFAYKKINENNITCYITKKTL
tara:strand:+ start:384 stop:629 length:246 start_codon:yes stop_codon:yes gene_type:complete